MQADRDHALLALGHVEPAEERLLRKLRHADSRRVHEGRGRESAGVGGRTTGGLNTRGEKKQQSPKTKEAKRWGEFRPAGPPPHSRLINFSSRPAPPAALPLITLNPF